MKKPRYEEPTYQGQHNPRHLTRREQASKEEIVAWRSVVVKRGSEKNRGYKAESDWASFQNRASLPIPSST
jgi:hypothetical protein